MRSIVIYHYKVVGFMIIIVGCVVVVSLISWLLFRTPSSHEVSSPANTRLLSTDVIDELELWIEERQTATSDGLRLPPRDYFARPILNS